MADHFFRQSNREAKITLVIYGVFFVWWYVCAYVLGSGDPAQYSFICGFPVWFFLSCIVGYLCFSLLLWLVLRKLFRPLDLEEKQEESASASDTTEEG